MTAALDDQLRGLSYGVGVNIQIVVYHGPGIELLLKVVIALTIIANDEFRDTTTLRPSARTAQRERGSIIAIRVLVSHLCCSLG